MPSPHTSPDVSPDRSSETAIKKDRRKLFWGQVRYFLGIGDSLPDTPHGSDREVEALIAEADAPHERSSFFDGWAGWALLRTPAYWTAWAVAIGGGVIITAIFAAVTFVGIAYAVACLDAFFRSL